jgi:hypothetical protein
VQGAAGTICASAYFTSTYREPSVFLWVLPGSTIFSRSCFSREVYNETTKPISDSADGRKVKYYRSLINPSSIPRGTLLESFLEFSFFFVRCLLSPEISPLSSFVSPYFFEAHRNMLRIF